MAIIKKYHLIIGLLLLAGVIIAMAGTPSTFLGKNISFIYSNLSNPTDDRTFVRTTMDFGDSDSLQKFPKQISDWKGSDYEISGLKQQLGADVMLLRAYTRPGLYQPMFFLIMQSQNRSSFHEPEVCYRAAGWEIVERETDTIDISNAFWAEKPLYPESAKALGKTGTSLSVKRLVITKGTAGENQERRLTLYFYAKCTPSGRLAMELP